MELPKGLADDDDDLVDLPDTPLVDIQVNVPADVPSVDDIEIDIPAVDEMVFVEERDDAVAAIPTPPEEPVLEPRASAPAPTAPASPVALELAEVDEYIALGLYEDARDTLRELQKQHPGEEAVAAKLEELGFSAKPTEPSRSAPATAPSFEAPKSLEVEQDPLAAALPDASHDGLDDMSIESLVDSPAPGSMDFSRGSGEPFIDLASELSDEIFGTQAVDDDGIEPDGPMTDPGLDQIFKEFRKGVEKQLGAEDYDTRYNLGIAYKEMGLTDEAIAEFQLAAKDEVRGLECCSMLGLCFMEKGMPHIAIKWFSKGLGLPDRRVEEYQGLRYDLAQAHQAASEPARALELYMEIYKDNARFRDVKDRVRELQATRK
ncbi:MAG: tetratricopeptide repeat protein [Acidobacteria bacterium]|nr:MAG: tetratricopeptide repeat protein [Acidobacteriota bacterium]